MFFCSLSCRCHRRNLDSPVSSKFWNETIWDHTGQCVRLSSILEEVGFCPLPILWCKLAFRKIENPHQMCILSRLETSYFGVFSKERLNSILLDAGKREGDWLLLDLLGKSSIWYTEPYSWKFNPKIPGLFKYPGWGESTYFGKRSPHLHSRPTKSIS